MENEIFDIFEGHRERLRAHIDENESLNAQQYELIEFLLCYIYPRQDLKDIAHALVERFGNAENVLAAGEDALLQVESLGAPGAEWLDRVGVALSHVCDMSLDSIIHINNFKQTLEHVQHLRGMQPGNCTVILSLNSYGLLISQHFIPHGGTWTEYDSLLQVMDFSYSGHSGYVVIISFMENRDIEPTDYEKHCVEIIAGNMNGSRSVLADFVHVCGENVFSMRMADMIRGELDTPLLRSVCERYMDENPVEDDCSDIKGVTL